MANALAIKTPGDFSENAVGWINLAADAGITPAPHTLHLLRKSAQHMRPNLASAAELPMVAEKNFNAYVPRVYAPTYVSTPNRVNGWEMDLSQNLAWDQPWTIGIVTKMRPNADLRGLFTTPNMSGTAGARLLINNAYIKLEGSVGVVGRRFGYGSYTTSPPYFTSPYPWALAAFRFVPPGGALPHGGTAGSDGWVNIGWPSENLWSAAMTFEADVTVTVPDMNGPITLGLPGASGAVADGVGGVDLASIMVWNAALTTAQLITVNGQLKTWLGGHGLTLK